MPKTWTAVVMPNSLFRDSLVNLLADSPFHVAAKGNSARAIERDTAVPPAEALFLLDFPARQAARVKEIHRLKGVYPQAKVLVLAEDCEIGPLSAAVTAGADGMLPTSVGCDALFKSMELVMLGLPVLPVEAREALVSRAGGGIVPPGDAAAPDPLAPALSEREMQILSRIAKGWPNKVIARELGISESTVKTHTKSILRKIRAKNRTVAAMWAIGNLQGDDMAPAANDRRSLH